MKRTYIVATIFLLVIAVVAGGVWRKKVEEQRVEQPVVSPTVDYDNMPGSYTKPIQSFSGETYLETDGDYAISMVLPVEFKPKFERDSLKSNSVSFMGYSKEIPASNGGGFYILNPKYYISFRIYLQSDFDQSLEQADSVITDSLENLKVGESYTYSPLTIEQKIEIFGEDSLKDWPELANKIYVRVSSINGWNVYKYTNHNEGEPSYGYTATQKMNEYYVVINYSTFYERSIAQNYRDEAINYHKDLFISILKSTTFSK